MKSQLRDAEERETQIARPLRFLALKESDEKFPMLFIILSLTGAAIAVIASIIYFAG